MTPFTLTSSARELRTALADEAPAAAVDAALVPLPARPVRRARATDAPRGSVADFANPSGANLVARTGAITSWIEARRDASVWPFFRAITAAPTTTTRGEAEAGEIREGLMNLQSVKLTPVK